jgi:hypothetical protein
MIPENKFDGFYGIAHPTIIILLVFFFFFSPIKSDVTLILKVKLFFKKKKILTLSKISKVCLECDFNKCDFKNYVF